MLANLPGPEWANSVCGVCVCVALTYLTQQTLSDVFDVVILMEKVNVLLQLIHF